MEAAVPAPIRLPHSIGAGGQLAFFREIQAAEELPAVSRRIDESAGQKLFGRRGAEDDEFEFKIRDLAPQ